MRLGYNYPMDDIEKIMRRLETAMNLGRPGALTEAEFTELRKTVRAHYLLQETVRNAAAALTAACPPAATTPTAPFIEKLVKAHGVDAVRKAAAQISLKYEGSGPENPHKVGRE